MFKENDMKTTELRIGNIVNAYKVGVCRVDGIESDILISTANDEYIPINDVEGIPLNEQWLFNFGFKEVIVGSFIKESEGATLIVYIIDGVGECIFKHYSSYSENDIDAVNVVCLLPVSHVHQLQNLYFTLTQEELILK